MTGLDKMLMDAADAMDAEIEASYEAEIEAIKIEGCIADGPDYYVRLREEARHRFEQRLIAKAYA